jgi:hypothetical protein
MPMDKYKSFFEIVKILTKLDLTKLRAIEKEIRVLSKIKSKVSRKKTRRQRKNRKRATAKQLKARQLFAKRVKNGDFR